MDAPAGAKPHPCRPCGACCATFRVSFYFTEVDLHGGTIPVGLTGPLSPLHLAMRGTNQPDPRCVALDGTIGTWTGCTIHAQRPTPCREFKASWEDGTQNTDCDRARARHGLAPLTPSDWTRGG